MHNGFKMQISLLKKACDVSKIKEDLTRLKIATRSDRETGTVIIVKRLSNVVINIIDVFVITPHITK